MHPCNACENKTGGVKCAQAAKRAVRVMSADLLPRSLFNSLLNRSPDSPHHFPWLELICQSA